MHVTPHPLRHLFGAALACFGVSLTVAATPPVARVEIDVAHPGPRVSPTMHGVFFEDINFSGDGGLYAELINNRSFEDPKDRLFAWETVARDAEGSIEIADTDPLNSNNPHFVRINVTKPGRGYGIANSGFGGIAVKGGATYLFSVRARALDGYNGPLQIDLVDGSGAPLATNSVYNLSGTWQRYETSLVPRTDAKDAHLIVLAPAAGTVDVDVVSLFPKDTWKGRPEGLRADLVQLLADMRPGFVRFPGGCIVEGVDFHNMYRWKDTVGDIAERKQNWNLWQTPEGPSAHYSQTYGLGFLEYFQLCEDIGAAPVPIVNCGMCCQARGGPAVPLDELDPYVQDALDLIEFANGSIATEWGAKRAALGHPEPFGLKYLGVGNEQWDEGYFERYAIFWKALKAKHPEITIITTAGPHPNDQWWNLAWKKFRSGTPAEIVDEHYYRPPLWFLSNSTRYDSYDRAGPKVFAGEFAAHDGRRNNLNAALAEAAYMTGLWRNADVVVMAAYAPLFAKVGFTQWEPDLIWFDNTRAYGSPSYHVQAIYSRNRPDVILPVAVDTSAVPVSRIPSIVGVATWLTEAEYKDLRVQAPDGRDLIPAGTMQSLDGWQLLGGRWSTVDGALHQADTLTYDLRAVRQMPPTDNYTISLKARRLGGREGFMVFFDAGTGEPARWNVGGWDNTQHSLDIPGAERLLTPGTPLETGRWYEARIEVGAESVKCFLDGVLLQELPRPPINRNPVPALFAAAGRDDASGEIIVALANPSAQPIAASIDLAGAPKLGASARAIVLAGDPTAENSLEHPDNIAPQESSIPVDAKAAKLAPTLPAHSFMLLRVPVQK